VLFETVYDIRQAGCRDGFLTPVALVLLIWAVVNWRKAATGMPTGSTSSPALMAALFGALTLLTFFVTWGQYWLLLGQLNKDEARQVQGVVRDFRPAPTYKGTEHFSLAGHEFSYSRFETRQGFHTLAADGGPIVNGACVRLLHVDNHILRLEVAKDATAGDASTGSSC
jgi:hypothetical protein